MNTTFKVGTLFDCGNIECYRERYSQDYIWGQTVFGCRLLLILQDMYGFNITYVIPNTQSITEEERTLSAYPMFNDSIDIYARPLGFTSQLLDISYPVGAIFTWRYGFILKRPYNMVLRKFYSLPFTVPVWNCLFLTILLVSGIFFYLSQWEKKMLGGYSSYHYELLLTFGACCQRILPLQANIASRRIAYLSFIMGAFIINSFYCSNLLSHLVNDKDNSMDLKTLANSDYKYARVGNYYSTVQHHLYKFEHQSTIMNIIQNQLFCSKYMNIIDGLNAVMTSKTALLSDYSVVTPVLTKMYGTDDICQLIQIDLLSNIKKYFYTSKNFSFKQQFKIGLLKVKEAGILQKILRNDKLPPLNCAYTYPTSAGLDQIIILLAILLVSYMVAVVIMLLERWHYRRYKVLPYVN